MSHEWTGSGHDTGYSSGWGSAAVAEPSQRDPLDEARDHAVRETRWLEDDLRRLAATHDPTEWAERRAALDAAIGRLRAWTASQTLEHAAITDARHAAEAAAATLSQTTPPIGDDAHADDQALRDAMRIVANTRAELEARRSAILNAALAMTPRQRAQIAHRIRLARPDDPLVATMQGRLSDASRGELLGVLAGTHRVKLAPARGPSIQRKASGTPAPGDDLDAIAQHGTSGGGGALPHFDRIQASFGAHDISGLRAHVGSETDAAAAALGARAFAYGDRVAFAGGTPDLHTAAHEAAHYVQQRAGVHLAGGIDGGAADPHERRADAVADAVVRGESTEALLGPVAPAGQSKVVQRKGVAAADPQTKQTVRISRSFTVKIGAMPAKVAMQFDFGTKDRGSLHHALPGPHGSASWLSNQQMLESTGDALEAKLRTSLVSGSFEMFANEQLPSPLSELPLSVKLSVSGLDASISTRKLDLKMMSVSLSIEGDFSAMLTSDQRKHLEAKGSIQLQLQLDSDLAKQIIELNSATNDLEKAATYETDVAKAEQELAEARRVESRLHMSPEELDKLGPGTMRNARVAAQAELRELEREVNRLRGMRGRFAELRNKALGTLQRAGKKIEARLGKTVLGRTVNKLATKALGLVFDKIIPIWNTISTIEDIYDAANYLAHLDWSAIADKIANGGDGGEVMGDGGHHESGAAKETAGEIAADTDALERDLDARANVQLHPAADAVLAAVDAGAGAAAPGAHPLAPEEKESINVAVPEDLTPQEIEQVKARLASSGVEQQDMVESVIAAVQYVRPFGEKQAKPVSDTSAAPPGKPAHSPAPHAEAHATPRTPHSPTRAGATQVIDLEREVERLVTIDPVTGQADYPYETALAGVRVFLTVRTARFGTEDVSFLVRADVRFQTLKDRSLVLPDGSSIADGSVHTVTFTKKARSAFDPGH